MRKLNDYPEHKEAQAKQDELQQQSQAIDRQIAALGSVHENDLDTRAKALLQGEQWEDKRAKRKQLETEKQVLTRAMQLHYEQFSNLKCRLSERLYQELKHEHEALGNAVQAAVEALHEANEAEAYWRRQLREQGMSITPPILAWEGDRVRHHVSHRTK
ncbi:MAG: hypothetical protein JNM56_30515 [Planctomycetia bacterium]|nr:hypothetical protein [Planctomycetia bacterium]